MPLFSRGGCNLQDRGAIVLAKLSSDRASKPSLWIRNGAADKNKQKQKKTNIDITIAGRRHRTSAKVDECGMGDGVDKFRQKYALKCEEKVNLGRIKDIKG